jgi:hypothetical protein
MPAVVGEIDAVVAPVLQAKTVEVVVAVKVAVAPAQTAALFTVTTGFALIVTVPAAVEVQPYWLVAVTVKVPAVVLVIAAVVAPVFQTKVEPADVAVKVAVAPAQTAALFTVTTGFALIVTVPVAVAVQPYLFVAVTV